MQSQEVDESQVILLYYISCSSELKVIEDIIAALKPYALIKPSDIQMKSKDQKYSAYINIPAQSAKAFTNLQEIKVGDSLVNVKRYYSDHQLYINKLPIDIMPDDVSSYFSKLGKVLNVVFTPNPDKKIEPTNHCFIKFEKDQTVSKIFLLKRIEIKFKEIRVFRTYKIGESQNTDKKLFFKADPTPDSIEAFEKQANQYFQSFGELRERIRLENIGKNVSIAIITYTSTQSSDRALSKFDKNYLKKDNAAIHTELQAYINQKEDQSGNKIFAAGIHKHLDDTIIRNAFEVYGQITELSLIPNKVNTCLNATIVYAKKSSASTLLAEYVYNLNLKPLFISKPFIELFLSPVDRKGFKNYMSKNKYQKNSGPMFNSTYNQAPPSYQMPVFPQYAQYNHPTSFMINQPPVGFVNPNIPLRSLPNKI